MATSEPGILAPPHKTGMYTVDALLAGQWSTAWDAFHHLILPALVLAAFSVGLLTRYTRSAVLEVIGNDYVQGGTGEGSAGGKRAPPPRSPRRPSVRGDRHRPRLRERAHGDGARRDDLCVARIGQYAYRSAVTLDLPAIMGVSLFVAVVYITINFVVDVLYGVIDPRIRVYMSATVVPEPIQVEVEPRRLHQPGGSRSRSSARRSRPSGWSSPCSHR